MNLKSVYVVIINFNHLDDLKETINSFIRQDYLNQHIIVSDNGSSDNSVNWLKENHPEIHIIENNENLGWAEGNNVGIRYALNQNADYILLANNDLSFHEPTIISSLLFAYNDIPDLGIIGPSENSYYDKEKVVNQGWIMFPKAKYCFNVNREKYNRTDTPKKYKIIDNVSGSFMIVKRQVFKVVGEFDSALFLYAEDMDFSIRAWAKGWCSAVNKEITIYHKISATSGNNSPLKLYFKTRNLIYLIKKHKKQQSSHIYFICKYYTDFFKQSIKIMLYSVYTDNRWGKLKAHFIGFIHGAISKRMNQYY